MPPYLLIVNSATSSRRCSRSFASLMSSSRLISIADQMMLAYGDCQCILGESTGLSQWPMSQSRPPIYLPPINIGEINSSPLLMLILFIGVTTCGVGLFFLFILGVALYIGDFFRFLIKNRKNNQSYKEHDDARYKELVKRYRNVHV